MHVGSTVWIFDGNHRVYRQGQSAPVYREHFRPHRVVGATLTSWLLEGDLKVNKRTGLLRKPARDGWYGLRAEVYTTIEQVNDDCYVNDERHKIAFRVGLVTDAEVLRKVVAVLRDAYGDHWNR